MNRIVEGNYFDVLRHWSNECIDELVAYLNLIQSGKMKIIHLPNIMKDTLHSLRKVKCEISKKGAIE